jgi:hypothetical protein
VTYSRHHVLQIRVPRFDVRGRTECVRCHLDLAGTGRMFIGRPYKGVVFDMLHGHEGATSPIGYRVHAPLCPHNGSPP